MMAAAAALDSVVQVFRGLSAGKVQIDTGSFSLHYRATTTVFVALGSLLFTTTLMVSPLQCQPTSARSPASTAVINAFCFSTSTFSLPPEVALPAGAGGSSSAAAGGQDSSGSFGSDISGLRRHSYYPWVAFLLLLHGLLFYLPHWLWFILEGKRLASVIQDTSNKMAEKEQRHLCLENVALYLRRSRGQHQTYFILYLVCEILNFVMVICGLFLIDAYLGGGFWTYGSRILGYISSEPGDGPSPMEEQFPKLTGCRLMMPGPASSTLTVDAVCVLSMNTLYEKVYLMLWFWLVGLSAVSGGSLIRRLLMVPSTELRAATLRRRAPLADPSDVTDLATEFDLGDMFMLSLIAENIDSAAFRQLAAKLTAALTRRPVQTEVTATVHPKLATDDVGVFRRPSPSVSPTK